MSIDRYRQVVKGGYKFKEPKFKTSVPKPTESDYSAGFIYRYFAQKTNDIKSPIFEVDLKNFSKLNSNPYYIVTSIKWRISGNLEPIYDNFGNIKYKSVADSNRLSIMSVQNDIKNLKLYLQNLLQFHK